MRQLFTLVDDFYDDFPAVRAAALAAEYEPRRRGKYPGVNSRQPHFVDVALPRLSAIAGAPLKSRDGCGSGCFRLTLASDEPELDIHFDNGQLSAVVFLNSAEQCAGRPGTAFYRHTRTGQLAAPSDGAGRQRALDEIIVPDSFHHDRWELQLSVTMAPNRLVIFPSSLFHAPADRFGTTREDGRLIQVFFLVRE
jgi:hypothetical protein